MIYMNVDATGRKQAGWAGLPRFTRPVGVAGMSARLRPAHLAPTGGGSFRTS